MNTKTTQEDINKLIEFRQAIYQNGILKRRDAVFELLDALVSEGPVSSYAMLSLSGQFRRKWPSVYAAIEDSKLDSSWLRKYLMAQVTQQGICIFPLDGSAWPRPRSRVLEDLQNVYQASSDVNGGTVTVGYPYSCLEWCAGSRPNWSLPVDVRRIPSSQTAQEMGATQIKELARLRVGCAAALDIVAADGKYGNAGFLRTVKGLRSGIVVRLRCDRVLYHSTPPPTGKKGRPKKHGERFAFKEADSWGEPDEVIELEDPRWGKVRLERWLQLHEKKGCDVPYDVIRACVHLEREKPPKALWLAWLTPPVVPKGIIVTVETIWRAYGSRWSVEPGIHFRKDTLKWTLPRFQTKEAGDRWTELTMIACWIIFLARRIVADQPYPWQKPQQDLTSQRVQQSIRSIFAQIGTPAQPPKMRGKASGWSKGRPRTPKTRHAVVRKTPATAKTA